MRAGLVLSPVEPGNRRVRVKGVEVGHALTWWDDRDTRNGAWTAYLWKVAGDSHAGWVTGPKCLRLRELRAALEKRLADDGEWWQ
jgi:hypothetical protein